MVQLVIENLLSTSANRVLYEALWFLAITKGEKAKNSKVNFDSVCVSELCNELIQRVNNEAPSRQKFLFSSQLAFGTLKLYCIQVEKLLNQTKIAVQTCKNVFSASNWLNETSDVKSILNQKPTAKKEKKTAVKQQNTSKKNTKINKENVAPTIDENYDLIEEFFNIPEEVPVVSAKKNARRLVDDSGIDPTVVSHAHTITILEPKSMFTSGFNSMIIDEDDEYMDDDEFANIFRDTEGVVNSQSTLIAMTSTLLKERNAQYKDSTNSGAIKKRRLTYNMGESDLLRFHDPLTEDVDFSGEIMMMSNDLNETSTFVNQANDTEMLRENPGMQELTLQPPILPDLNDINMTEQTQISKIVTINRESFDLDLDDVQAPDLVHIQSLVQDTLLPQLENADEDEEPEFVLEEIPVIKKKKTSAKKSKLIIDKVTTVSDQVLKKNNELYVKNFQETSPFARFNENLFRNKSSAEKLFSMASFRLQKSKLAVLYMRNMVKISQKLANKRPYQGNDTENDINNGTVTKRRKSERTALQSVNYNQNQDFEDIDLPVTAPRHSPRKHVASTPICQNYTDDVAISPVEGISTIKKCARGKEKSINEESMESSKLSKQEVLQKLKSFWKKRDTEITMEKLCCGMTRIAAASTFFCLLELSKSKTIELIQKEGSLEITNVVSKKKRI